jgi:peptidoglycan LD-endopeptidase LytH
MAAARDRITCRKRRIERLSDRQDGCCRPSFRVMDGRVIRHVIALCALAGAVWWVARSPQGRFVWWLATAEPPARYIVPVEGVRASALRSSFGAPRSGSRAHQGIDILAPRGTPVVAAARGLVVSTRPNRMGGTVVWVMGAGRRLYYYAHLDRLEPGIEVGRRVEAAQTLGVVGTTGNARGGPPHLHFGIYTATGTVDPYPLLRAQPRRARERAVGAVGAKGKYPFVALRGRSRRFAAPQLLACHHPPASRRTAPARVPQTNRRRLPATGARADPSLPAESPLKTWLRR